MKSSGTSLQQSGACRIRNDCGFRYRDRTCSTKYRGNEGYFRRYHSYGGVYKKYVAGDFEGSREAQFKLNPVRLVMDKMSTFVGLTENTV